MDLALTNTILKTPNYHHPYNHQTVTRTNSQQIISPSSTVYSSTKQPQANFNVQFNSKATDGGQQQINKPGGTRKFHFGASKTMGSLLKPNSNDDEYDNYYDSMKYQVKLKKLLQNVNESLNLVVNGITSDHKRADKVTLYVCLVFLKIGEIDTIKERFQADAYIESYWEDENVDPTVPFDHRTNWNPELHIENAIGELKQEIRYKVEIVNNKPRVYEMRNIKGVFWERLELWDFPLDVQELSITLSTSRNENEIQFEENKQRPCAVNTEDFLNQQEWNIFTHVSTSKKAITDLWNNCKRPCFSTTALVSRKPGYFIYNAYMLIFFVSALGFVPFSFSVLNNHFRIQVTSLLILTSVNFRWIVTQRIPTVSYLTTLDKYAIVALIFLVALCGWHATIGSSVIYESDMLNKERVDLIVLIIIGILYVLYQIIYFILFYLKYRRYKHIGNQALHEIQSNTLKAVSTSSLNKSSKNFSGADNDSTTKLFRRKSSKNRSNELTDKSTAAVNTTTQI